MAAVLFVVLGVVAVVTGAYAYVSLLASPKFLSVPDKVGRWTRAVEISRETAETEGYWVLEDPDPYILVAMNYPNSWIQISSGVKFRFLEQALQHGRIWNVEYEGRYYAIDVSSLDPGPYG